MYDNNMATYDELLALHNKLKIHQRHLQFLAIEMYKSKNKLNPSFLWKIYKEKNIPYPLRRSISLLKESMHFDKNETELKMGNPTHSVREMQLALQLI